MKFENYYTSYWDTTNKVRHIVHMNKSLCGEEIGGYYNWWTTIESELCIACVRKLPENLKFKYIIKKLKQEL